MEIMWCWDGLVDVCSDCHKYKRPLLTTLASVRTVVSVLLHISNVAFPKHVALKSLVLMTSIVQLAYGPFG